MKKSSTLNRVLASLALVSIPFVSSAQCVNCGTGANGAYVASSSTTLAGGTYNYSSFTIQSGVTVTVTGSAPLIIYCQGAVNISGTLNASGGNGTNGVTFSTYGIGGTAVAGGHSGGDGIYIGSGAPGVDGTGTGYGSGGLGWSGGGGAGYANVGGSSGGGGGTGGVIYSNGQLVPLDGGSGGGGGSGGNSCGSGGGGAGGGIIVISACNGIFINAGGSIISNGGNGGSDGTGNCGGGGGGSGGTIFLASTVITNSGIISAVGGTGGASAVPGSPYYGTGANGSDGRIRMDGTISGSGTITPAIGYTQAPPSVTITSTNVTCNGACNGSATANPTGGTSPYTFLWTPGGVTTASVTGLCPGTYTCTVTDANGCSATATVNITEPPVLSATVTQLNDPPCFGVCNGTATIVLSGGTPTYSYSWSNGNTSMSSNALCAGSYTVVGTDANGCTATVTFALTEPPALTVTMMQLNNPTCFGDCNGTATIVASGGTPGYTYQWSNGNTTSSSNNLCAGTYTIIVTDANGCTTTATFTLVDPPQLVVAPSVTQQPSCAGSCDGSVNPNASGGTGVLSYMWIPALPACAGSYTLTVTDANGCTATGSATLVDPQPLMPLVQVDQDVTCNGACNGMATASVTGGTSPYMYSWNPSGCTSPSCNNLCAGTYLVDIIDMNGCATQGSVSITEPPALVASATSTPSSGSNGTLSGSATGGTPGYFYTWQPGNLSGASQSGLAPGSFTLTVTDIVGCTDTTVVTVLVDGIDIHSLNADNINLYPNPSAYQVMINVTESMQLDIYDAVGKQVSSRQLTAGVNSIDVSQLANGMYSFRFSSGGTAVTKKITVVH